jgi:hypothetical protein
MQDWSMRAALAVAICLGVVALPGRQPPASAAPASVLVR